jgi:hypothetical protein
MLTRTTLQPMPTAGSHEWFTRIITPSYSPGGERRQEAVRRDRERRIADGVRQARDGRAVHDMAAFDRGHLRARYHLDGMHSLAFDGARAALGGLRGNPRPDPRPIFIISGRHTSMLAHAGQAVLGGHSAEAGQLFGGLFLPFLRGCSMVASGPGNTRPV